MLAACGGGGGDASPPSGPTTVPPLGTQCLSGSVARLALPAAATAGRNQELALLACPGSRLDSVQWRQTDGPALALGSARSQALSVAPAAAGRHAFSVDFSDAKGASYSGTAEFTAAAAGTAAMLIRGEPSVWAGGQTSLRAWVDGLAVADYPQAHVRWSRVEGPDVNLGDATQWRVIFTAPAVSEDSLLRLRAEATLADGRSLSQDFNLLVQASPPAAASPLFGTGNLSSRVYPYLAGGAHAAELRDCIYTPTLSNDKLCTLGRLPILGTETRGELPTVEQVMARVLVSNDWMGQRFEAFLREQDGNGDFRRLLNATTAIVIGGRVRPSFYWSATGAIYLDADYLWQTPAERDTVSEAPDPRSDYGNDLAYTMLWRYVQGNKSAGGRPPVLERTSRDSAALLPALGRLLYHELIHANDFLPPRVQLLLNTGLRVYEAVPANTASEQLRSQLPFYSQEMVDLGRVQFFGAASTAVQRAYQPADITRFFSGDRVTDEYSYSWSSSQSTPREDAAMLAEEALMQLRHGVLRDVAITPQFKSGETSADLVVSWGQRGRVGDAAIKPRVALVLAQTMPWLPAGFTNGLAAPAQLRAGLTWGQNLDQSGLAMGVVRPLSATERALEADLDSQRRGSRKAALAR
ncbi:hypothetical protein J2X20_002878 [Pelomonas saccharophila]|uniref:Lipoprotein n=1 Tax=Roseateles saccharophilus TaxID=304 RepID=A0ABU1YMZ5_ROSSA|nr:hypothetical protein [Roseateles saccharophilus]MDR7270220.1 hypothetical protein [Roseateles saccharophilus]